MTPLPRQRGHGCESAKRPWESETVPEPPHCGHVIGEVPGLGARAVAGVTGGVDLDRDAHLRAREGVLEREPHARLEVGAALRLRSAAPRAATAAEDAAELAEQVGEVDVLVGEAARARAAACRAAAVLAERVVLLALLGVGRACRTRPGSP